VATWLRAHPDSLQAVLVTVAALKGGVGKTTVAAGLASAAAARDGRALLVDVDPQGSAMLWAEMAGEDERPGLAADTVGLPSVDLKRRLPGLIAGYPVVVLDTPPGNLKMTTAAIALADVVVVPCPPLMADVARLWPTLELVADAGGRALVVINRARAGTRSLAEAQQVLAEAGAEVSSVVIPQREAIASTYGVRVGEPLLGLSRTILDELSRRPKRRKR
jgi:chromosome partitioning protein